MLKTKSHLTHISLASFYGKRTHKTDQDQTPQNEGSGQGIQYLLTEGSYKLNKMREK